MMAQTAGQSLPMPDVRSSNPDFTCFKIIENHLQVVLEKLKKKIANFKTVTMAHYRKQQHQQLQQQS